MRGAGWSTFVRVSQLVRGSGYSTLVRGSSLYSTLGSRLQVKQFDFNESRIFGKFDLYCKRVQKLMDMLKPHTLNPQHRTLLNTEP